MWRLFYPLRYFSLVNNEKRHIDLWPTALLAVILATPFVFVPGAIFFSPNGFLDKLLTLTTALTGFYVAALVAAATFSHPDLDKTIRVGSIALVRKGDDGVRIQDLLTRREFACTIFGYLAFATLAVSLSAAVAIALSAVPTGPLQGVRWVGQIFELQNWLIVRGLIILLFTTAISHITVVTSLGLYYLMDRLYRQEPRVTAKKSDRDAA